MKIQERINNLKREKDAVILAHYYVNEEVQKLADFVGDSYALAKKVATIDQKNIIFAGVSFMGESAKLLNPDKHVYMVDCKAGCKMADMITTYEVNKIRSEYPKVAVVCYVNSSAAVKAVSDVCVTSSNAVKVVKEIENTQIYFIPDSHLAHFVAKHVPEKEFIYHNGFCPIHRMIDAKSIIKAKSIHPNAKVLTHPECMDEVVELSDYVGSTADIIDFAKKDETKEYIIATETGVFYQLQTDNPDKIFYPVIESQICPDMKLVTLEKIEKLLTNLENEKEIVLDDEVTDKAKKPLEQMLILAGR